MPDAVIRFDKLVLEHGQIKAMKLWAARAREINAKYPWMIQKLPETDPYMTQINFNMIEGYKDGMNR